MTQPAEERLWPEEELCGCMGGECTVCEANHLVRDVRAMFKEGKPARCWMHATHCEFCFACNVVRRELRRLNGETVPPPPPEPVVLLVDHKIKPSSVRFDIVPQIEGHLILPWCDKGVDLDVVDQITADLEAKDVKVHRDPHKLQSGWDVEIGIEGSEEIMQARGKLWRMFFEIWKNRVKRIGRSLPVH